MNYRKGGFVHDYRWTAIVNVATTLLGILTGTLLARYLGPEGRGVLAAIQNIPTMVLGIGTLGITSAAAYFSGREPSNAGHLLSTCLISLLLWSIPLIFMAYLLMPFLLKAQSDIVIRFARIYLLIIPIQFAIGVPFWILQGLREFRLWNILRFQSPLAWFFVIVFAWMLGRFTGEDISIYYLVIMSIVACVFIMVGCIRIPPPRQPIFNLVPSLLRYGLPSTITVVPQQLNFRLDQLLMAGFLPPEMLGLYVVAVAWSWGFSPILTSIAQVLFPRLAATLDKKSQAETLHQVLRISVLGSAGLTVLLMAITPFFLPLLFGRSFVSAVPTALLLVVAAGMASLSHIASEGLRGLGMPKKPMFAELIGLVVTIILLGLLLFRYKIIGAAIASLVSYMFTLGTLVYLIAKETHTSPLEIIIPKHKDIIFLLDRLPTLVK